jgi:uracil-DNA glycosylase
MKSWSSLYFENSSAAYASKMKDLLDKAYATQKVYPPRENIYQAFEVTPLEQVKVVIIGQDPYHQFGQANGLCFSVNPGIALPPSLRNIYKEIETDLHVNMNYQNGDLHYLAKQGVLLLNSHLTVVDSQPLAHQHFEYQAFFRDVFALLASQERLIVYLLWGTHGKKYLPFVTNPRHIVLTAHHPSPLSANRGGWFGCKHFSKTNSLLIQAGLSPIHWTNTHM